jgi:hypothetical protein
LSLLNAVFIVLYRVVLIIRSVYCLFSCQCTRGLEIGNIVMHLRGLGRDDVSCIICLCTFAAVFEEDVCASLKSVVFDLLCFGYILLIQLDGD